MVSSISLGQYIPGESVFHNLDPRSKILSLTVLVAAVFFAEFPRQLVIMAAFSIFLVIMSRVSWSYYLEAIKPFMIIISITLILQMVLTRGDPLFNILGLKISRQGVLLASALGLRLVIILVLARILTLTTTPLQMTTGLELMLKPLSKLGFPAHELVMIMTISLRFIPIFVEEATVIQRAQMCRGVDYSTGNLFTRVMNLISILVPLFRISFERANDLAIAMESRAYQGGEGRTHLNELSLKSKDYLAVLVSIVFITILELFL